VSLATVRALIDACHRVGATRSLRRGLRVAQGVASWSTTRCSPDRSPYGLGDFLFLVDPAAADWQAHFTGDWPPGPAALASTASHLDQYGYPKRAHRPDGAIVDVAESFVSMIDAARRGARSPPGRLHNVTVQSLDVARSTRRESGTAARAASIIERKLSATSTIARPAGARAWVAVLVEVEAVEAERGGRGGQGRR